MSKSESTANKPNWWNEEQEKDIADRQWYDDSFFEPYRKKLEPIIPADYKDEIFDQENKLLLEKTPSHPNPTPANPNYDNLFAFYDSWSKNEGKDVLVAILIPSFNGDIDLTSSISLMTMYKPKHRFHTIIGHNIDIQRNQLVDQALRNKDITHVFFWDSDVAMPPYSLMRLIRRNYDIVSGIYTMKSPPYCPLAIKRPRNEKGERRYNYYINLTEQNINKVVPIDGAGAGCLLIKREVLEKMGPPWFQVTPFQHGISATGEDLYFYDKAIDMGYKPMLDLSVQCDHSTGFVQYPRLFLQGLAGVGQESRRMVDTWNKNAILWSLGMPHYDSSKTPIAPDMAKTSK